MGLLSGRLMVLILQQTTFLRIVFLYTLKESFGIENMYDSLMTALKRCIHKYC